MQTPNDKKRVHHEIKTSFGLGLTVCGLLMGLLFTSNLYSQTPPNAPSGLAATPVSSSQINLTWTDNADNEVGFKIERKDPAGVFTEITTVDANVTNYSSTGLTAVTEYFYRVRAYNAGGNSAYTDSVSATTLPNLPAAPTNLLATAVSNSQIDLAWTDNAANESGFIIERSTASGGPFTKIDTVGADETAFSNTGLSGNTTYYYRIRAYNAAGNSAPSNEANATTASGPPAAPSSLTYALVGNTQADLSWIDNANNELGFGIERKTGAGGTYAAIDSVNAGVTSFSDTGLEPGKQYFYRVFAYNGSGNSAYSNEVSVSTTPTIPTAPSNLVATVMSNTQIDLAWADNANNETGFKIERKIGVGGVYTQIATVGANVTVFSHTGLTANTQYFYRVRAYNAGGNSAYSNAVDATTLPNPPAAPSNLVATTVNNTQINLTWTDNANNEDGFKIERKTAGGAFAEIATVAANVAAYSDNGLSANTLYRYRVRAFNAGGNSAYTDSASATTLPDPPGTPSGLTATAVSNSQINLAWTDNAANEDSLKIERKIGVAGTYTQIAALGPNVTSYNDTGLSTSTEYYYRVRASNTGGNSSYSNEANATTFIDPPAAPSNLTATTVNHAQIDLAWTDNAGSETGFKIERKSGVNGTYVEIVTVGANVTAFSNTGLNPGTGYYYRVRAFNDTGNSGYSNDANALTMIKPPIDLMATAASSNQIDLVWTDQTATETGYSIERKIGGGTFAEVATVGANVTSFSNTGLNPNTQYFYRVRAFNAANVSPYTNEANATTPVSIPAAPSNLAATAMSHTQIDLAWTDNAGNENGFKIERKSGVNGTYAEIATVDANVTTFSNTGLNPGAGYYYRVRAFNDTGDSDYSNDANALTMIKPPVDLVATAAGSNQIDLIWTDQTATETGFSIERKILGGAFAEVATVGANVTAFSNTGLDPSTQYFYRVRAFSAFNVSPYTNEANATTALNPPAAPGNLTVTPVSHAQINLIWTDNSSNETGFKIERKTGVNGAYAEITTVGANVTTFSNTGLNPGTGYFYRIRAFNGNGNSDYSNEANALTLLKPPIDLVATSAGSNQINLTWTDQTATETGYSIERKILGGAFAEVATVGANVTAFLDTALNANTKYFYRVRAFNTNNASPYTNEADATTAAITPAAPSNLAATPVSHTQINLAWTDNAGNETGFKIERKTGVNGIYAEIATVGANMTTFANTGLTSGVGYFYRVRAFNGTGNSDYSNEGNALAMIKPPSDLMATAAGSNQIDLIWTDQTATETGYSIERKTGAGTFAEIATVGANVTAFTNTGLDANTQYFYRVRAFSANNTSPYTNEADATTMPLSKTSESETPAAMASPNELFLAPNYPNPFNPSTTISYSLPEGMHVTLTVVNITGQEVARLVDGHQERGVHRLTFNAADLPTGIYYAVLRAGEARQVQRMIFAK